MQAQARLLDMNALLSSSVLEESTMKTYVLSGLALIALGTAWAAVCKNGGQLIDGNCTCLPGFIGEDCNTLKDFCHPENSVNSRCAPDGCVTMYGGFWCSRCKNESRQGIYCNRPKSDPTVLMLSPYTVFPPQMHFMETITVLFSVERLGDGFSLEVRWGDGAKSFRDSSHFRRSQLSDEVPALKVDALAPGTEGFNAMPKGQRYFVKLNHVFNTGDTKNKMYFIANNYPRGPSVDMKQQSLVYIGPAGNNTPTLTIPKCGDRSRPRPQWARFRSVEVEGVARWDEGEPEDVDYYFVLITNYGTEAQRQYSARPAPDKRFSVPAYSLPLGTHCLEFSAWRNWSMQQYTQGFLEILALPVAVVLLGGDERNVGPRVVQLDASLSVDPNERSNNMVKFTWSCKTLGGNADIYCDGFHAVGPRTLISASKLKEKRSYVFSVNASRPYVPTTKAKQIITMNQGLRGHLAITCSRNCGRGGAVVTTENVWLRAFCKGECPDEFGSLVRWNVEPPLALGNVAREGEDFIIKAGAMRTNKKYTVTLSGKDFGSSKLSLKTQGLLKAECAVKYSDNTATLKCSAQLGNDPVRQNMLYQVFQMRESKDQEPILLEFTYVGEVNLTNMATPEQALLSVRVSHISGAFVWVEIKTKVTQAAGV